MDTIVQFRQMKADQKFSELQKLIEVQLTFESSSRHELLILYYDVLNNLQKEFPEQLALELATLESEKRNHDFVLSLISHFKTEKYVTKVFELKITAAEDHGQLEELYNLVSSFLMRQCEKQIPMVPDWIIRRIDKYFSHDFNLKLKRLAIMLLLNDVQAAEKFLKDLLLSIFGKSSSKGVQLRMLSIGEVLRHGELKFHLEIYQHFCLIYSKGIRENNDYKRIVEMIIYFDDFKFQLLILDLIHKIGLNNDAVEYASGLKENPEYSYIYVDKFFSHLKPYFLRTIKEKATTHQDEEIPDLKLSERYSSEVMSTDVDVEESLDEKKYYHLLKYQSYSLNQLCDLAVSFLQSEMPNVALKATELAIQAANDDKEYLKGSYLKLTCLLVLKDYRAAVDTAYSALEKSSSQEDVLSFLYGQAEAYMRLNQKIKAIEILEKIIGIDHKYRLAKERLDKLNEV